MTIRPIHNDADLRATLTRIEALWGAPSGTHESDEMEVLAVLVEDYENRHFAVDELDPVPFLVAHMEATGRTQADLGRLFGSAPRASEVLGFRRSLSKEMILALQEAWGIPASVLIKPYALRSGASKSHGRPATGRADAGRKRHHAA
jgi:HTH-type transcriptional regulator/antitoxin HigA